MKKPDVLYVKLMQTDFAAPFWGSAHSRSPEFFNPTPLQEHGVKAGFVSQEKLSVAEFQSIFPLKCVLGAGENELGCVLCRAFLSTAIIEDPSRQSRARKVQQNERSVLAVLYKIIVSPLDALYCVFTAFFFFCFSLFPCLSVLTFASLIPFVGVSIYASFSLMSPLSDSCDEPVNCTEIENQFSFV